ncbi:protein takeout-like [Harmonia axyridis]|uniref:protein takeout-like n=1 Tax=Harmonia axyridis TaxID=115357 RepID=UPI001E278AC8|nr:protein takeout-like [Harmonia axyridis]
MTPLSILLFVGVFIVSVHGGLLPTYITACKVHSPGFKECAIKNGNAAIPSLSNGDKRLGIPTFNPLLVPFIEFSSGSFKLNGTDVVVSGLPKITINDMKVDTGKKKFHLNVTCPEIVLDLNYNIGGKIASLPLEGHGKGKVVFYEPIIIYDFDYAEYDKNGNKHLDLKKDHLDVFPTKLSLQLNNLFNGNKALGESTNKLLNENWPEVLDEFRPAINEIVGAIIRSVLVPLSKKVPLNEIFTDY